MKIIAVTNRKGGVGKSTMTTHIAAGLALAGLNVGIVDTDSQGHAGLMLGQTDENGLYAALIEKKPLDQVARLVQPERYVPDGRMYTGGNLWLLPSSDRTYRIPYELKEGDDFLFLETLENFGQWANLDVILVDTNPTLSLFDGAVWMAADGYLYVTECERLSLDGVQSAIEQMYRVKATREKYMNRTSQIYGIIPNKMRAKTNVHRSNISQLAEAFPQMVWTPVMLRTEWVEATDFGEMIYRYAPDGQAARDAYALATRMMEAIGWQTITTSV